MGYFDKKKSLRTSSLGIGRMLEIYDKTYLPNQPTVQNDPMAHYPPSPPWQQGVSNFLGNLNPQDAIAALAELLSRQSSPVDQQNPKGRRNFWENTEVITPSNNPIMDAVRNNWENTGARPPPFRVSPLSVVNRQSTDPADPAVVLTAQPNTAIHDINKLADLSVLKGAEIADTNTEESPWMIDTPLGQLDLKGFVQNFLRQSRNALAMPVHAGDWGLEPLARAQVMEESAAAASAQETAAEYIKQGIDPTTGVPFNQDPVITSDWQAKKLMEISNAEQSMRIVDKALKISTGVELTGIWESAWRGIKEFSEALGVDFEGDTKKQQLDRLRAQFLVILTQTGVFGREISKVDELLAKTVWPSSSPFTSMKELQDALNSLAPMLKANQEALERTKRGLGPRFEALASNLGQGQDAWRFDPGPPAR